MAEMALVTVRKARLQKKADKGDETAKLTLELANNPNMVISIIQIGITMLTIILGAVGESNLRENLVRTLNGIPFLSLYSEAIAFFVVVVGITFISIVLGELVPKRLAFSFAEPIAMMAARPLTLLMIPMNPFVKLLSFSTDTIVALMGIKTKASDPVSEEEIKVLIEQASSAGVIEKSEKEMVNKIFTLNDTRAMDLMTPVTEIVWLSTHEKPERTFLTIRNSPHSHYPVHGKSREEVVGMVDVKEILEQVTAHQTVNLTSIVHEPLYVPETTKVGDVLEHFRQTNVHLALVVDEYGKTRGLITVNDIFEAIVGEIPDLDEVEEEANDPSILQREENSWVVDGIVSLDEFEHRIGIHGMVNSIDEDIQTIGGFVMHHLDKVPKEGDILDWNGYRFEVIDMDRTRVDKVIVTKL